MPLNKIILRLSSTAFPFIEDEELRRRIVGYKPISEEEWKQLWPSDLPNQEQAAGELLCLRFSLS
jgi:hypothetical protein